MFGTSSQLPGWPPGLSLLWENMSPNVNGCKAKPMVNQLMQQLCCSSVLPVFPRFEWPSGILVAQVGVDCMTISHPLRQFYLEGLEADQSFPCEVQLFQVRNKAMKPTYLDLLVLSFDIAVVLHITPVCPGRHQILFCRDRAKWTKGIPDDVWQSLWPRRCRQGRRTLVF